MLHYLFYMYFTSVFEILSNSIHYNNKSQLLLLCCYSIIVYYEVANSPMQRMGHRNSLYIQLHLHLCHNASFCAISECMRITPTSKFRWICKWFFPILSTICIYLSKYLICFCLLNHWRFWFWISTGGVTGLLVSPVWFESWEGVLFLDLIHSY